ncbi:MAG: hypothetical protein M9899_10400 [Bdellovibrionaceae bacterium]|nr:hypothetical protein [Pseudobdellovibrionaceae bacterium]
MKHFLLGLLLAGLSSGCAGTGSKRSYCDIVDAVNVESTADQTAAQ